MRLFDVWSGRGGLLLLAGFLAGQPMVRASEFSFEFKQVFTGQTPTATQAPWVEAVFEDVSPGTVRLTVSNLNLSANENVAKLYFNLNPALDPGRLNFQFESSSGGFAGPSIVTGASAYLAPGLHFSISLGFPNQLDSSRNFDGNEYFSELITGIPTLTAEDFDTSISRRAAPGTFYAAAQLGHIDGGSQGALLTSDRANDITPVPEPGSSALLSAIIGTWLAYWAWKRARECAKTCQLKPVPVRRTRPTPRNRDS